MEYDAAVHNLQCPKCNHGMEEVTHGEVVIDRCTNCQGLWFDESELTDFVAKQYGVPSINLEELIGSRHFGRSSVRGNRREPCPALRMTAFIPGYRSSLGARGINGRYELRFP